MIKKDIMTFASNNKDRDYIEPEIVNKYWQGGERIGLFEKIKFKIGKFFLFLIFSAAFIFVLIGVFLSSTIIGSVIGIPMIILGFIIIFAGILLLRFVFIGRRLK